MFIKMNLSEYNEKKIRLKNKVNFTKAEYLKFRDKNIGDTSPMVMEKISNLYDEYSESQKQLRYFLSYCLIPKNK